MANDTAEDLALEVLGREAGIAVERTIGAKHRELRTARGWSQQYVADRMTDIGWPMHQSTVQKLEAGTRPLRVAEAASLASLYEMPLAALMALPFPGEPLLLTQRRERLVQVDDLIESLNKNLHALFGALADAQAERLRLVQSMRDEKGGTGGKSRKAT